MCSARWNFTKPFHIVPDPHFASRGNKMSSSPLVGQRLQRLYALCTKDRKKNFFLVALSALVAGRSRRYDEHLARHAMQYPSPAEILHTLAPRNHARRTLLSGRRATGICCCARELFV